MERGGVCYDRLRPVLQNNQRKEHFDLQADQGLQRSAWAVEPLETQQTDHHRNRQRPLRDPRLRCGRNHGIYTR